ncbi:uncharacterized protein A1O5_11422, partial [Cladophialophora psammophila CBS 110553]
MHVYPDFDSLPRTEGQPQGNAWGLWRENEKLGTLNYLTPEVILQATKEIKAGVTVQLDLPLSHFDHLGAGRQGFSHQMIDFKERLKGTDLDIVAHDDVLTLNTQSSSQWDGLRRIGLQESGIYYGGVKHRDIDEKREDGRRGIHKWVKRGGIAGRGVLFDYHGWRQQTGQAPVTIPSATMITTEELEAVAKHQGTQLRDGDILVLRTGFTDWHRQASKKEQQEASKKGAFIGLEATEKSVKVAVESPFRRSGNRYAWIRSHSYTISGARCRASPGMASGSLGDANRRALGSREVGRGLLGKEAVVVFPDQRASSRVWRSRHAAQCNRDSV